MNENEQTKNLDNSSINPRMGELKNVNLSDRSSFNEVILNREKQRDQLLTSSFYLAIGAVITLYLLLIIFICCASNKLFSTIEASNFAQVLQAFGGMWHIILILTIAPTTILGILLRSVSFNSNANEISNEKTNAPDVGLPTLEATKSIVELCKTAIEAIKK